MVLLVSLKTEAKDREPKPSHLPITATYPASGGDAKNSEEAVRNLRCLSVASS